MMIKKVLPYSLGLASLAACSSLYGLDDTVELSKKVDVFGVRIWAASAVPDEKLLHAASVMAEYLDNDEDGIPDNSALVNTMVKNKATLVMAVREGDLERIDIDDLDIELEFAQDLYALETHPNSAGEEVFDGALEEVLHLISAAGYEQLYPDAFSVEPGSKQSNAMDIARGGQFNRVPRNYPQQAWYSYDDRTCDYECQGGEYFYWALTSLLGAQQAEWRQKEIADEWRLPTPESLKNTDKAMYELLVDPQYKMPTRLPDGDYRGKKLQVELR